MAVSVVTRFPDLQAATYDEVIASLDLDVNPPAGAILHVAGDGDDGRQVPAGIYFVRLEAGGVRTTGRVVKTQ